MALERPKVKLPDTKKWVFKDVVEWAHSYAGQLTAYAFDNQRVRVVMQDGSEFLWANAFAIKVFKKKKKDSPGWIIVFSEHYSFHVFDLDDIVIEEVFEPVYE